MTKVKFYVDKDGSILAYFPDELFDGISDSRTCYAHIGQHSACSPYYLNHLKYATPEQYADLLEELKGHGYDDLVIVEKRKQPTNKI